MRTTGVSQTTPTRTAAAITPRPLTAVAHALPSRPTGSSAMLDCTCWSWFWTAITSAIDFARSSSRR
jgi:hypothetical protein